MPINKKIEDVVCLASVVLKGWLATAYNTRDQKVIETGRVYFVKKGEERKAWEMYARLDTALDIIFKQCKVEVLIFELS